MAKLIMFHGQECPHCRRMMPIVKRLEEEMNISLEKLEIWHNEDNADRMRSYKDIIKPNCGGQLRTPTFLNTETQNVLCGEVTYDILKQWTQDP